MEVAAESGIDADDFAARYDDEWKPLAREVYDDHNDAINSGVAGVPAVVIDGQYLVSGAVDTDHYRKVLAHVRSERDAATD